MGDTGHGCGPGRTRRPLRDVHGRMWWLDARLMSVAWITGLLYGSLIPFNFRVPAALSEMELIDGLAAWLMSPRWVAADEHLGADVATNLVIYAPLGAMLMRVLRRMGVREHWALVITVSFIMAMSWMVECAQALVPVRVSSAHDVMLNVIGGIAGAMLGPQLYLGVRTGLYWLCRHSAPVWFALLATIRRERQQRPARMACVMLAISGVVLAWYVMAATPLTGVHPNWKPFAYEFKLPYDMAARTIGRTVAAYVLIGVALSPMLLHGQVTTALVRMMFALCVVSAVVEQVRHYTAGAAGDVTEPLLASLAGFIVVTSMMTFARALRAGDRRRATMVVALERRTGAVPRLHLER